MLNNEGLKMEPWGTPCVIVNSSDRAVPNLVDCAVSEVTLEAF